MAIIHFINYHHTQTSSALRFVLHYTTQEKKTVSEGRRYVSGVNCSPESALLEFQNTKRLYRKEGGRQFYHFTQSFSPGEPITPAQAHEIALELVQKCDLLSGYEVVVSTHCDRDHIHSHFVVNSVNYETGTKFHISKTQIESMMALSDEIVGRHGFSVLPPPHKQAEAPMSDREYRSADRGQSWKLQLAANIQNAMEQSGSREQFIVLMEAEGYHMAWTPERKYITYTCPDGHKCRDSRLHEEKYRKENMEYEFEERKKILGGIGQRDAEEHSISRESNTLRDRDRAQLERTFIGYAAADADTAADQRADADAGMRGGSGQLTGKSDRDHCRNTGRESYAGGRTSGEYGTSVEEVFSGDKRDGSGAQTTGWEDQRQIWATSLGAAGANAEVYNEGVLDLSHPHSDDLDLVLGAADLVYGVESLFEDRQPVQDTTTMKHPKNKKKQKQSGPVMGGM